MRDFLPAEVKARERVLSTVRGVFESYGFAPLETPAIERLEILQGKYGEEGDRLIFKVAQRGAKAEAPLDALRRGIDAYLRFAEENPEAFHLLA